MTTTATTTPSTTPAATDIGAAEPGLHRAAVAMSRDADTAAIDVGLSPRLVELVKIRVSQLNGCAFCLRWHVRDALAMGETSERLALLAAWHETSYFDGAESDALRLAEHLTRIGDRTPGEPHGPVVTALTPDQVAAVSWVAITIGTLNRVAITSRYAVAPSFRAGDAGNRDA